MINVHNIIKKTRAYNVYKYVFTHYIVRKTSYKKNNTAYNEKSTLYNI